LVSCLCEAILGQENGRVTHYHPTNLLDKSTLGISQGGMKWGGESTTTLREA